MAIVSFLKVVFIPWIQKEGIGERWNELDTWRFLLLLSIGILLYEFVLFLYRMKKEIQRHSRKIESKVSFEDAVEEMKKALDAKLKADNVEKENLRQEIQRCQEKCLEYYESSRKEMVDFFKTLQRQFSAQRTLLIDYAEYGAQGKTNKVAHILRSKISSGKIEKFPVNNNTLGPDPISGVIKSLVVNYTHRGESKSVEVPENGMLSLP